MQDDGVLARIRELEAELGYATPTDDRPTA
jgi:hypothetical protein